MTKTSAGKAANANLARVFHGFALARACVEAKPLVSRVTVWHSFKMNRAFVNQYCAGLPGADLSDPWGGGHDAWKVGGKLFAVIGTSDTGVSVKCADVDTAALLIEMGRAERAAYFHRSWVHIPWDKAEPQELQERLSTSYQIIRSALPKKLQAGLV